MRNISTIIIHHSASPAETTTTELILEWHLARKFHTYGYHWMIDQKGTLFEGRSEDERGAHCDGHNTGSIGICLFGNFENEEPTHEALCTLEDLIGRLQRNYNIVYIKGHKDFEATFCPGKNLYSWMQDRWGEMK